MRMTLKRRPSAQSTPGELFLDGVFECYTLENPAHGAKPHKAIPAGRYAVDITYSPRFARPLPRQVPFEGTDSPWRLTDAASLRSSARVRAATTRRIGAGKPPTACASCTTRPTGSRKAAASASTSGLLSRASSSGRRASSS